MDLYARYLLPRLTHLAMDRKLPLPYQQRVISGATGRVLEIGVGSGLNLPLYSDGFEEVIGIDISPELLAMAERAAVLASQRRHLRVRLLEGSAESLPSTIAKTGHSRNRDGAERAGATRTHPGRHCCRGPPACRCARLPMASAVCLPSSSRFHLARALPPPVATTLCGNLAIRCSKRRFAPLLATP